MRDMFFVLVSFAVMLSLLLIRIDLLKIKRALGVDKDKGDDV